MSKADSTDKGGGNEDAGGGWCLMIIVIAIGGVVVKGCTNFAMNNGKEVIAGIVLVVGVVWFITAAHKQNQR